MWAALFNIIGNIVGKVIGVFLIFKAGKTKQKANHYDRDWETFKSPTR